MKHWEYDICMTFLLFMFLFCHTSCGIFATKVEKILTSHLWSRLSSVAFDPDIFIVSFGLSPKWSLDALITQIFARQYLLAVVIVIDYKTCTK